MICILEIERYTAKPKRLISMSKIMDIRNSPIDWIAEFDKIVEAEKARFTGKDYNTVGSTTCKDPLCFVSFLDTDGNYTEIQLRQYEKALGQSTMMCAGRISSKKSGFPKFQDNPEYNIPDESDCTGE